MFNKLKHTIKMQAKQIVATSLEEVKAKFQSFADLGFKPSSYEPKQEPGNYLGNSTGNVFMFPYTFPVGHAQAGEKTLIVSLEILLKDNSRMRINANEKQIEQFQPIGTPVGYQVFVKNDKKQAKVIAVSDVEPDSVGATTKPEQSAKPLTAAQIKKAEKEAAKLATA